MRSTDNADIFVHSDAAQARAYRQAAETVRHDPYFPDSERENRARYYEAEAARYERRVLEDAA